MCTYCGQYAPRPCYKNGQGERAEERETSEKVVLSYYIASAYAQGGDHTQVNNGLNKYARLNFF